jgi:hypothetical protein
MIKSRMAVYRLQKGKIQGNLEILCGYTPPVLGKAAPSTFGGVSAQGESSAC